MIETLPLCGPPGYSYETTAPFFICHIDDDDRSRCWTMWTLESAIVRFWLAEPSPARRVLVDAMGVTVLGTATNERGKPQMCGTRQTMEETLTMVRRANDLEMEAMILSMIETIRLFDGQAM